jgi:hypothetical protein
VTRSRSFGFPTAVFLAVALGCRAAAPPGPVLTLHSGGVPRTLDASSAEGRALLETCEDTLRSANAVMQLAITPELVDALHTRETSLEIGFPTMRAWKLGPPLEREVSALRILIPLSGDLAGSPISILIDAGDGFSHGPLAAPGDSADISRLLPR